MPTVVISGYYGFNNIGDEAVLSGLLAGMRAEMPAVTPVVLSADPAQTAALHGVEAVPRMQRQAVRKALERADLFVSGGGSLLQDVTSLRSSFYYLGLLWWAQRRGVPTMIVGQGIGPLCHPLTRWAARRVLNQVQAITVRDAASAAYLTALGVTQPTCEVTADLAYLLDPTPSDRVRDWWVRHVPEGRPVIAVALRSWPGRDAHARYTAIADSLAALAAQCGALLLFLPFHHDRDLPLAEAMAGWTPAESRVFDLEVSPAEMLGVLAECDFVVAMRLHAMIFAVHAGVPTFGLAYDPKVTDCAREAGLPTPLPWDAITTEALTQALLTQWEARDTLRATVRDHGQRLATLARRNIAVMATLLARGDA